jgi:holo-[acyl-carrier protein] synthase
VVVSAEGQPSFALSGTVAARAADLGVESVHLSLSHDGGLALAFIILES